MKYLMISVASLLLVISAFTLSAFKNKTQNEREQLDNTEAPSSPKKSNGKVQVAILLDTSNSMDGLIDQAKNRLWDIVNTLSSLYYQKNPANIEIALYEYGNDNLSPESYYVHKVLSFTNDLDEISAKLFSLTTNGGEEYCGAVIKNALQNLEWSSNEGDIKLIYVAGKEAFNQGPIDYRNIIKELAVPKSVQVNTIFCGNYQEGVNTSWANGASIANGKYFSINSDNAVRHTATPYDDDIIRCNAKLNSTYIGYGSEGKFKSANQSQQDANAESVSKEVYTKRVISKSKKSVYKNTEWDLVDKYEESPESVKEIKDSELPQEMQGMTEEEKTKYIVAKSKEREELQKEIADLNKKRIEYIKSNTKEVNDNDLGTAINKSIKDLASRKGYEIKAE